MQVIVIMNGTQTSARYGAFPLYLPRTTATANGLKILTIYYSFLLATTNVDATLRIILNQIRHIFLATLNGLATLNFNLLTSECVPFSHVMTRTTFLPI